MGDAKATGYYSCGHVVLLSGYDEDHKKEYNVCPQCRKGTMTEMRRLVK